MNLDDLTIGEARKLAALFGNVAPAASALASTLYADLIGKPVLVRSRGSGVWAATLDAHEVNAAGNSVRLSNARRLWSWTGAGECSSLALTGPSGGKIGPACSVVVNEVLEVHPMQPAAVAAVAAVSSWTK